MNGIQRAELKDSWPAWLGVSLVFIVTNASLVLAALVRSSGMRAVARGQMTHEQSAAFTITPVENMIFCAIVGAVVIGSATELVMASRRAALARLALAGATPRQILCLVLGQIAAVSLMASAIGSAIAYAMLTPALAYLAHERSATDVAVPTPDAAFAPLPACTAAAFALAVALIGGLRHAIIASRVDPLDALRQPTGMAHETRMTIPRWLSGALLTGVIVALFLGLAPIAQLSGKEAASNMLILSMAALFIAGATFACFAPLVVRPLTRLWTTLLPLSSPSWQLARRITIARAPRLIRSVIPIMLVIGTAAGLISITDTLVAVLHEIGFTQPLSGTGYQTFLVLLGLPLLVATSGMVGSLIMMARQRDAELALLGIAGADPRQRLVIPALEALILVGTSALMGIGMMLVSIGLLAVGFPLAGVPFAIRPSIPAFAVALAVLSLVTIATTVLPTLAARSRPEPSVISQLRDA